MEVDPTLLLIELPQLQPRFYSISSSPLTNPKVIDATVGLISYRTQNGAGPVHNGVCTAFLSQRKLDSPSTTTFERRSTQDFFHFHAPVCV